MRLQEFPEFLNIICILRIEMEITPSMELFKKFILNKLAAAQESKVTIRMPVVIKMISNKFNKIYSR